MLHATMIVIEPDRYLSEAQVQAHWTVLRDGEIRRARKRGQIAFYAFPTGPHYTAEAVQEYIDATYRRTRTCPAESSQLPHLANPTPAAPPSAGSSGATISTFPTPTVEESSTPAGMTPALAQSAAEACALRIAKLQNKRSSRSAPPRRPARPTSALTLVRS